MLPILYISDYGRPTQQVEPSYQVVFGDDDRLDLFTDRAKMKGACFPCNIHLFARSPQAPNPPQPKFPSRSQTPLRSSSRAPSHATQATSMPRKPTLSSASRPSSKSGSPPSGPCCPSFRTLCGPGHWRATTRSWPAPFRAKSSGRPCRSRSVHASSSTCCSLYTNKRV